MKQYQIVDRHGDVVVTADTITAMAKMQRTTPRKIAARDAKHMSNEIDGTFAAVPA